MWFTTAIIASPFLAAAAARFSSFRPVRRLAILPVAMGLLLLTMQAIVVRCSGNGLKEAFHDCSPSFLDGPANAVFPLLLVDFLLVGYVLPPALALLALAELWRWLRQRA